MNLSHLPKALPPLLEDFRFGTKAHDLFAAIPLVAWYGLAVIGQGRALKADFGRLDLSHLEFAAVSELLSKLTVLLIGLLFITFLFLRTPPKAGARGLLPRMLALLGTYLSVGIALLPHQEAPAWVMSLAMLMVIGGGFFAVYSILWLGRSFSLMPEARRLVTGGPYSIVRHPLYVGEELAIIGAAVLNFSGAAFLLLIAQIGCQLWRMQFEEEVLTAAFPDYAQYRARTFRILPGIY
jgi:protein-S-isoprenylcysteine O-methyltransferase Ste14